MKKSEIIKLIQKFESVLEKPRRQSKELDNLRYEELKKTCCELNDELFTAHWNSGNYGKILEDIALIAVKLDDPIGMCNLGIYYKIIKNDDVNASLYFKMGHDLGVDICTYNYFMVLMDNYLNETNKFNITNDMIDKMIKYYENITNDDQLYNKELAKYRTSLYYLGNYYLKKAGDNDKASEYFKRGHDLGDKLCTNNYCSLKFNMGKKFYEQNNFDGMIKEYELAANAGDNNVTYLLGKYYSENKEKYDTKKDVNVMYYLGMYYYFNQDYENAEEMAKRGYELEDKKCQELYGLIKFSMGFRHSEKREYDKMKENYKFAIKMGNTNAMNNLGIYYHDIEKNNENSHELALHYTKMAMDLGHEDARDNYHSIKESLMCIIFQNLQEVSRCYF